MYETIKLDLVGTNSSMDLPKGFFYVNQDNYCVVNMDRIPPNRQYLYSDSATSCIITILCGRNIRGDNIVALAHLSRSIRYDYFFNFICNQFSGPVKLWAQGGNPSDQEASIRGINTLLKWLNAHSIEQFEGNMLVEKWFIEQTSLSLGQGDPLKENRSNLGIDLIGKVVTNKAYDLTLEQRDPEPTSGIQTLFAVFGMRIWPKVWIWNAEESFPTEVIDKLVAKAREDGWVKILDMNDGEILRKYSSTPQYEPAWFVQTLKQSAKFVKNYKS
jgi:hypothetical protein